MVHIYYRSDDGLKSLNDNIKLTSINNPTLKKDLDKLNKIISKNFMSYSKYEHIVYDNINIYNFNGKSGTSYKIVKTVNFISSEYDWILMLIMIFSLFVILISFVDYCFVNKRKYDIKIYSIFE